MILNTLVFQQDKSFNSDRDWLHMALKCLSYQLSSHFSINPPIVIIYDLTNKIFSTTPSFFIITADGQDLLSSTDGWHQTLTHCIDRLTPVLVWVPSFVFRSRRWRSWCDEEAWSIRKEKGKIREASHHHICFHNTYVRLLPYDYFPCLLSPALSPFLGFVCVFGLFFSFIFPTRIVVDSNTPL